jgi:hypothetical protein
MSQKRRIMLTVSRALEEFLSQMAKDTGIDRSNLIRMKLWEWRTEERHRNIEERKVAKDADKPTDQ